MNPNMNWSQNPMMNNPLQRAGTMQPMQQMPNTFARSNTMAPQMGNPMGMGNSMMPNCGVQLLGRGNGIDDNEYNTIINSAMCELNNTMMSNQTLSQRVISGIKSRIGGEWFVLDNPAGMNNYDFCLTVVTGNDFFSFIIQNTHFQVCRLRD